MIVAERVKKSVFRDSTHQLAQEFLFIHAVLEGLASVDKYYRDFVIKLPPQVAVAIHIHFVPGKPAAARELRQTLLHNFAEVTTLARVNHDLTRLWHAAILPLSLHPLARKKMPEAARMPHPGPMTGSGVESENARR